MKALTEKLLPEVHRHLRASILIQATFDNVAPNLGHWRQPAQFELDGDNTAELELALSQLSECLEAESGNPAWNCYMHAAQAVIHYVLGSTSDAASSLTKATHCLVMQAHCAQLDNEQLNLCCWLLVREADLLEAAGSWEALEDVLLKLLKMTREMPVHVFNALSGNFVSASGEEGSTDQVVGKAEHEQSPLKELWARLAKASFHREGYVRARSYFEQLEKAGVTLDHEQAEQMRICTEAIFGAVQSALIDDRQLSETRIPPPVV